MTNHIDDDTDPFESPLAIEFQEHCTKVQAEIKLKVDEARRLMKEATDIADKNGVPFRASVSPLSNSYVPKNFSKSKFAELDIDVISEISGAYGEYMRDMLSGSYGGWVHSAVC